MDPDPEPDPNGPNTSGPKQEHWLEVCWKLNAVKKEAKNVNEEVFKDVLIDLYSYLWRYIVASFFC